VPLAVLLGVAGVVHLWRPDAFTGLIPRWLGNPAPWVYASGAAEIACAAGLAVPRTRRLAGWATAALFVAVFPGNVTMAARALASENASTAYTALTLARLPLQVPLVWWAVSVARRSARPTRTGDR
jgi:uncharacterized membrane protein